MENSLIEQKPLQKKSSFKGLKAEFHDKFLKKGLNKVENKQEHLNVQRRASDGTDFKRNVASKAGDYQEQHPKAIHSIRRVQSYTKSRLVPIKQPKSNCSVLGVCEETVENKIVKKNNSEVFDIGNIENQRTSKRGETQLEKSIQTMSARLKNINIQRSDQNFGKISETESDESFDKLSPGPSLNDSGRDSIELKEPPVLPKTSRRSKNMNSRQKVRLSEAARLFISMSKKKNSTVTSSSSGISSNSYRASSSSLTSNTSSGSENSKNRSFDLMFCQSLDTFVPKNSSFQHHQNSLNKQKQEYECIRLNLQDNVHCLLSQITKRKNGSETEKMDLFRETTDKILAVEKMLTHTERRLETINAKMRKLSTGGSNYSSCSSPSTSSSSIGSPINRTPESSNEGTTGGHATQIIHASTVLATNARIGKHRHQSSRKHTTYKNAENTVKSPVKRVSSLKTVKSGKSSEINVDMVCTPNYIGPRTTRGILRSSFRKARETFRNPNNVSSRTGTSISMIENQVHRNAAIRKIDRVPVFDITYRELFMNGK